MDIDIKKWFYSLYREHRNTVLQEIGIQKAGLLFDSILDYFLKHRNDRQDLHSLRIRLDIERDRIQEPLDYSMESEFMSMENYEYFVTEESLRKIEAYYAGMDTILLEMPDDI